MSDKIYLEDLPLAVSQLTKKIGELHELIVSDRNKENQPIQDKPLSVEETAKFLDLTAPTIYSKVSKGELPVMKMKQGKRLYFSKQELLEYLKEGRKSAYHDSSDLLKKKGGNNE
jgi:excisionase family DNA binding protein